MKEEVKDDNQIEGAYCNLEDDELFDGIDKLGPTDEFGRFSIKKDVKSA